MPVAAGSPDQAYRDGVAAARDGDYARALRRFRAARVGGKDSAALHYNLGVAHYRLEQYEAARDAFRRAARSPSMRALAWYNLGLVAQAAGRGADARAHFRRARREAETDRLHDLTAQQLADETASARRYALYLEGSAGYDSNPRLVERGADDLQRSRREGDAVAGLLVSGQYRLTGDWRNGLQAQGYGYTDHYADLGEEDITAVGVGVGVNRSGDDWRQRYRLNADHLRLGGATLQRAVRLRAGFERDLAGGRTLGLHLQSARVDGNADSGFDYLDGWRNELRAALGGASGEWHWRVHYRLEHNDREDLAVGDEFFSVSPWRHEIGLRLRRPLFAGLNGEAGIAYRRSDYRDAEVRDGEVRSEREDDRLVARLGVAMPLAGTWTARLESAYWRNRSCFERFDYDRFEVRASLSASFR